MKNFVSVAASYQHPKKNAWEEFARENVNCSVDWVWKLFNVWPREITQVNINYLSADKLNERFISTGRSCAPTNIVFGDADRMADTISNSVFFTSEQTSAVLPRCSPFIDRSDVLERRLRRRLLEKDEKGVHATMIYLGSQWGKIWRKTTDLWELLFSIMVN